MNVRPILEKAINQILQNPNRITQSEVDKTIRGAYISLHSGRDEALMDRQLPGR
jgi:hypothetical protein